MKLFSLGSGVSEEVALMLDIGSGSVGGSLVLFSKNQSPKLLYTRRIPVALDEEPTSAKLFGLIMSFLERLLANIAKEGINHPTFARYRSKKIKYVFCNLSSPWCFSQTKNVTVNKKDSFIISKSFIDNLFNAEIKNFEKTILNGNKGMGDIEIIEKNIIQTRLNGYETSNPFSKTVKNLEMTIYMSFASKEIVRNVEKIIGKFFPTKNLSFNSFSLITFSAVSDIFPHESNCLLINVTGEITDISLVKNKIITETTSFPIGKNFFVRRLADKLSVSTGIALSYMQMHSEEVAEKGMVSKIEKVLEDAGNEWDTQFENTLMDISKQSSIPVKVFLSVDDIAAPLFNRLISHSKVGDGGVTETYFKISVLDSETLSHFAANSDSKNPDSFLAIESIFFNKIFQSNS